MKVFYIKPIENNQTVINVIIQAVRLNKIFFKTKLRKKSDKIEKISNTIL